MDKPRLLMGLNLPVAGEKLWRLLHAPGEIYQLQGVREYRFTPKVRRSCAPPTSSCTFFRAIRAKRYSHAPPGGLPGTNPGIGPACAVERVTEVARTGGPMDE